MRVRALRGVCIGVGRHLQPGDTEDLDDATVQFLVSIGAVEPVKDAPAPVVEEPIKPPPAKKPGKKE
jgi:hypothetical protein